MEVLRPRQDSHSQAQAIDDRPLTLVSFAAWALNSIISPMLPFLLNSAIIWIGKSEIGKSPVSCTPSAVAPLFRQLQESEALGAPTFQTANDLDYFRKEKGRRTKPRVFDDGNLSAHLRPPPPSMARGGTVQMTAGAEWPRPRAFDLSINGSYIDTLTLE